ncbi:uncharacterized protein LOC119672355 [Teleopsis dalmanni]|uniref:uncharacterized protein LOC119666317 n=1 Tax=Teleopsis dalmanni TaxID=139649 RepID=UPI0018CD3CA5|nr:uncharacterized protein LOC119666317 [Teleopsis dalmanni]XP_037939307.1 uncharacterized protein LOC119672355 [Teleopsis dalmanni]
MMSKTVLFLACCLAMALAIPVEFGPDDQQFDLYKYEAPEEVNLYDYETPVLHRSVRSPGGNIDLTYRKDQFGREAGLQYNHNIYKSDNGRFNLDAYAQGSRNFDHNRNNFGGGLTGSWRF